MTSHGMATPPDLQTALRTTGAIRAFTDRSVSRTELATILDVARFCPSGANRQPWHVITVEDVATRERLGELTAESVRECRAMYAVGQEPFALTDHGRWPGPGEGVDLAAARAEPGATGLEHLATAPAVLAVLGGLSALSAPDAELDRHGIAAGASIYPLCWSILLAARLVGLGGVLTTLTVRREPEVLELLGAPDGWALAAVISLGEPVHQPTRLTRRPVGEFATVDTFAGPAVTA